MTSSQNNHPETIPNRQTCWHHYGWQWKMGKNQGKRRIFGHEAGVLKARELVETAVKISLRH